MIKKGLKVKVLTGKDRNKDGEVMEIDRSNNRAKVKGINIIKKHVKTTKEKKGGIVSKENYIHLSNLIILEDKKEKNGEENTKQLVHTRVTASPESKSVLDIVLHPAKLEGTFIFKCRFCSGLNRRLTLVHIESEINQVSRYRLLV